MDQSFGNGRGGARYSNASFGGRGGGRGNSGRDNGRNNGGRFNNSRDNQRPSYEGRNWNQRNNGNDGGGGGNRYGGKANNIELNNMGNSQNWNAPGLDESKMPYNRQDNTDVSFSKFKDAQQQGNRQGGGRRQRNGRFSNNNDRRRKEGDNNYNRIQIDKNCENVHITEFPTTTQQSSPQSNSLPQAETSIATIVTNKTVSGVVDSPAAAVKVPSFVNEHIEEIKKVKIEKSEIKEKKPLLKQTPPSSSGSSSSSEDETVQNPVATTEKTTKSPNKQKSSEKEIVNMKSEIVTRDKTNPEQKSKKILSKSTSSSEEDSENSEQERQAITASIAKSLKTIPLATVTLKKSTKNKSKAEADVVCLGKLENKFVLDDDNDEDQDDDDNDTDKQSKGNKQKHKKSEKQVNHCIICDKKDHTSFECQMICKNCSAQYHNHKNCPKPPNLTIMMQSYMEFCMQQLSHFNPEMQFPAAIVGKSWATASLATPPAASPAASSTPSKIKRSKSKKVVNKSSKKRRKDKCSDSDEELEEEEQEEEEENTSTDASSSEDSVSESSDEVVSPAKKKRHAKKLTKTESGYSSPFGLTTSGVPAFTAMPAFGSAAAYNPMMYHQMLHGAFPTHGALNFKR